MYLDFFGLSKQPFNITPDPQFLFLSETHRKALDCLEFGVIQRRGFVLLTGDVGTGKTTLCRELLNRLQSDTLTALILNPRLSESQLLRAILHEFGVVEAKGDRLALTEQLNTLLLQSAGEGRNVVLIIDEAQHLSLNLLEEIRLLSNLETDDRKLMQIVLAGQPELLRKIADPGLRQLRQRITVRYHLSPLSKTELSAYVNHRLTIAGGEGTPRFERSAITTIHERSGGVPRLVNALTDMSLLSAFAREQTSVDEEHVQAAAEELRESLV